MVNLKVKKKLLFFEYSKLFQRILFIVKKKKKKNENSRNNK